MTEAGVTFRWLRGADITPADWDFFYRCYERTYLEHGNLPYLSRAFFAHMHNDMAETWVLFIAERAGRAIASSLIAVSAHPASAGGQNDLKSPAPILATSAWSTEFDMTYAADASDKSKVGFQIDARSSGIRRRTSLQLDHRRR